MRTIKTTNENVALNWARGNSAQNHGGAFSTDGLNLYSYSTLIGFTTNNGQKVLGDFTSAGGRFLSMTTSTKHVSPARMVATAIMHPDDFVQDVKEGILVKK